MQRGFEAVAPELREAAACCRMLPWRALVKVELPLAWPGILIAMVLSFAHTLGEFGIVLMVGALTEAGGPRTMMARLRNRIAGSRLEREDKADRPTSEDSAGVVCWRAPAATALSRPRGPFW